MKHRLCFAWFGDDETARPVRRTRKSRHVPRLAVDPKDTAPPCPSPHHRTLTPRP